jgi:non-ribosomal peptide synthetase component F
MSTPPSRLKSILSHLIPGHHPENTHVTPSAPHIHQLSPTFFLPRAAAIEPNAEAIFHLTTNGRVLRRSYCEFADRARGLAYYLIKHGYRRVGILAPNTPAFLESIYAIPAAGGIIVPANYRLVPEDIEYIFDFAEVDFIIADKEFEPLLSAFRKTHPNVNVLVDLVSLGLFLLFFCFGFLLLRELETYHLVFLRDGRRSLQVINCTGYRFFGWPITRPLRPGRLGGSSV